MRSGVPVWKPVAKQTAPRRAPAPPSRAGFRMRGGRRLARESRCEKPDKAPVARLGCRHVGVVNAPRVIKPLPLLLWPHTLEHENLQDGLGGSQRRGLESVGRFLVRGVHRLREFRISLAAVVDEPAVDLRGARAVEHDAALGVAAEKCRFPRTRGAAFYGVAREVLRDRRAHPAARFGTECHTVKVNLCLSVSPLIARRCPVAPLGAWLAPTYGLRVVRAGEPSWLADRCRSAPADSSSTPSRKSATRPFIRRSKVRIPRTAREPFQRARRAAAPRLETRAQSVRRNVGGAGGLRLMGARPRATRRGFAGAAGCRRPRGGGCSGRCRGMAPGRAARSRGLALR